MAALTGWSVVASATPAATVSVVSSAFTPVAGKLYVVFAPSTGSTAANVQGTISASHTGAAWTWNVGPNGAFGGNTTGGARWWWAVAPAGMSSGTVTVTLPSAPTIMDITVVTPVGDAHPTAPIAGPISTTGTSATSLSATLSATPVAGDMKTILVVNRNKTTAPTVVAGSGFVASDSAAAATPSASYLVAYDLETDTNVTASNLGTAWSALIGFIVRQAPAAAATEFVGFGIPI